MLLAAKQRKSTDLQHPFCQEPQCSWDGRSHFLTSKHIWPWFHSQLQLTLKVLSLLQNFSSWTWISAALIQCRLHFCWVLIASWQCWQTQDCYLFNNFLFKHVGLQDERWWLFLDSILVVCKWVSAVLVSFSMFLNIQLLSQSSLKANCCHLTVIFQFRRDPINFILSETEHAVREKSK